MYPFSAVVGQEKLKKTLLLHRVDPTLGGVLLSGQKGTAKSTLARSLKTLCADIPFVELPLNITEDRLLGSLDIACALETGALRLQQGLLALCDGGILYADEVNLLPRPIMALLLDAASSGFCVVEREGLRFSSRFTLLGSMNPEEGGLSPQLLERFAFFVRAESEKNVYARAEIVRRRLAYENDPLGFTESYRAEEEALKKRIKKAQGLLQAVELTDSARRLAARLATEARCAGNRAELILCKAARALAAWENAARVEEKHVVEMAALVLPHRMREPSQEASRDRTDSVKASSAESQSFEQNMLVPSAKQADILGAGQGAVYEERLDAPEEAFEVKAWLRENAPVKKDAGVGRRSRVVSETKSGRTIKTRPGRPSCAEDIAFEATLRAAVLRSAAGGSLQKARSGLMVELRPEDLRLRVRQRRTGRHILFVVDASGSMGAKGRMKAVKGAILSLLQDAYRNRDKVGLIAFRAERAETLLGFTRSVELAQSKLKHLPTGGKTPLAEGLKKALDTLRVEKIRSGEILPAVVLLSDGRATWAKEGDPLNAALSAAKRYPHQNIQAVVVDTEEGLVRLGLAAQIAEAMHADLVCIEAFKKNSGENR